MRPDGMVDGNNKSSSSSSSSVVLYERGQSPRRRVADGRTEPNDGEVFSKR